MVSRDLILVLEKEDEYLRCAALFNDDVLSFYFRKPGEEIRKGHVYLGKIVNSRIQQVGWFIDLGNGQSGFLPRQKAILDGGLITGAYRIVQIDKEARAGKTAELTEYIQIVGDGLIYLPLSGYIAVSRKIEENRAELRRTVAEWCQDPEGAIVRTSGAERTHAELKNELQHLKQRWYKIKTDADETEKTPRLICSQMSFIEQILNENHFSSCRVIANFPKQESEHLPHIKWIYRPERKLFASYGLDTVYQSAMGRTIALKSGGSLVIDYTEALTVIDVNSGSALFNKGWRRAAFAINCTAATEIARQLRLRAIGGMIVIDFLHLDEEADKIKLVQHLKNALKDDPFPVKVIGYTRLGLLELTRKKQRYGLMDRVMELKTKKQY